MANLNHLTIVDANGKFVISPIIMMEGMKDGSISIDNVKVAKTVQGVLLQVVSTRAGDIIPTLAVCDGRDSEGKPFNVQFYTRKVMVVTNVGKDKKTYLIVRPEYYHWCNSHQLLSIEGFIKKSAKCLGVRVSGLDDKRAIDRILNPESYDRLCVNLADGYWTVEDKSDKN